MIVDAFRTIVIGLKFLVWDLPKAIITFLFIKQNDKLKDAYRRRIKASRRNNY